MSVMDSNPSTRSPLPSAAKESGSRGAARSRTLLEGLVLFILAGIILHTWAVRGWWSPYSVSGPSMVPSLWGRCVKVTCAHCHSDVLLEPGSAGEPPRATFLCPVCGEVSPASSYQVVPGARVLAVRWPWFFGRPQRWEKVVLRDPEAAARTAVKRIVGLPGETVRIAEGDVFIDGRRLSKPWPVQKQMAVLVATSEVQPNASPERIACDWRPEAIEGKPSRWRSSTPGVWVCGPPASDREGQLPAERVGHPIDAAIDWLVQTPPRNGPAATTDFLYFSQNRSLDARPTADSILTLRIAEASPDARMWLRLRHGTETIWVDMDFRRGHCRVLSDLRAGIAFRVLPLRGHPPREVAASMVDRVFRLIVDDELIAWGELGERTAWPAEAACRWAIGCPENSGRLAVDRLRVFRDVYYRPRPGCSEFGPVRLGADEYFLLGDHSAVSVDSRVWQHGPGVSGRLLLGRAVRISPRPAVPFR